MRISFEMLTCILLNIIKMISACLLDRGFLTLDLEPYWLSSLCAVKSSPPEQ